MTHIRTEVIDAIGIITIDRAQRFNSLDVETARDLRKAGILFARDAKIRAVVLKGTNGIFCSGADLKYIRAGGDEADLAYLTNSRQPASDQQQPAYGEIFKQILEYLHSTISEIRRAAKPFIAAVDGIAAAGGFGLAMSCDLVVASDRACFEWAYAKTGLTGAESSTFFLPRLIGLRRSMEMLFLNPRLDAKKALEWGLITRIVPAAAFDESVLAMAEQVAALPTEAVGIAKDLMNQAAGVDRLDMHLDRELENLARIANGMNFAEGMNAFFEKRVPRFAER
ncbi:MAG TPA: enoyl-CoA hydratase-related protein [Thermoanaerobaculia bacterium]|nr:enoyl-CoA hydratase-related protein [Thermoanaerobaculia bacterium]